jgi:hypothetical protein
MSIVSPMAGQRAGEPDEQRPGRRVRRVFLVWSGESDGAAGSPPDRRFWAPQTRWLSWPARPTRICRSRSCLPRAAARSAELRSALGDPEFTVSDDTLVVAQTFRLAGGYAFGPDSAPAEGRPDLGSKAAIRANARRPSGRTPQAGTAAGQRNPLAAS